ncbi:MAG: long-chain fatty acid--CoA ligase [Xanthobacteraceae bacterium]|nr:long-chain fatty acid--CoA ligase [Xanthobacteraceae bacterium]MBX3547949.1 long-chain fatty acid--CoA ligase [Xanthobacteraceae bacterium]MCW5676974.1 long-chain fatty acid--CoA ligase [Xanthobacteraceae bacterium]
MQQIPDFARKRAELSPDAIAFHEVTTGRKIDFRTFDDRAERCASVLRKLGVTPGERVAILCHNNATFFEILFGCAKAGAILVPLNWRQTTAELAPIVADCAAKLLFHDAETAELAESLGKATDLRTIPFPAYETLIVETAAAKPVSSAWPAEGIWYLLYTSGTTGVPKAVIQTFGMALANYVNIQQATGLIATDSTLNFLPLFHTAGINLHALPVFIAGGTSHIIPKFEIDDALHVIGNGAITLFFGVPAIYQAFSLHPAFASADFSRVRHWGCGGAPLPENLIREFLGKGVRVCNGMGMTETGPTVFLMDPARAPEKIGSVGKPQVLTEVRLVDSEGHDVPDGERGELLFRGPNITPGYFGNPEATASAIDRDGWLRSGDVGRKDADGYYYIVDRIKDMYISGGENVYPAEVEAVLVSHPDVLEAAVLGVPDAKWGETGHAFVAPRPGRSVAAAELRAYARERLAAYKVPGHITLLEDFPRTAAGKVQKHLLRVRAQEKQT